ncbi:MAG: sigma-54-dependent transcriptional regulator [Thermodesulforhabdaceae bacterium]
MKGQNKGGRILVVDDEAIALQNMRHVLEKDGHEVILADNGRLALKLLETESFDVVVTDLKMEDVSGIDVLKRVKEVSPTTEVIVVTGYASVETAVEAMKMGAFYYLSKPIQINDLRTLVQKALEKVELVKEVNKLREEVSRIGRAPIFIGKSPTIERLIRIIEQIAPADCNVLIQGETGTGKELVARMIHQLSPRHEKRFVAINCGAFNEELLSSELFGHEKGAFTGAHTTKKGLIEIASGGTLFLDEIGEMPPSMQVRLLRVIQEKVIMRVGGVDEIPVDVRIIAATNKNLKKEVELGYFRQDLYYRLNVITIQVPPLRERKDDIPLLCHYFVDKFSKAQKKNITEISDSVISILMEYEFPGNVRELENIMERAVTLATGKRIEVEHLPLDLQQRLFHITHPQKSEFLTLEEHEREYIRWVLAKTRGNKSKAAEILGIDRVSLWRKLKKYNIST